MSEMLKRIGCLLAIMGVSAAALPAENGPAPPPGSSHRGPRLALLDVAGVYAVRQDKPFDPRIYDLAITGVSLRTYWRNIEPERGRFNWALFDSAIAQAAAKGKKVRLSIMFGSGVPPWVGARWFKGSADSEYDTANKPLPVPWDENLRREQRQIIRTFAERYRDNPHVAFFHLAGPSSIWEELALPKNVVDQPGWSQPQLWECWKEIIDQWQECRGNKRLSVAASAATSVYRKLGEDIGKYAVGNPADPNDNGVVGADFCLQWNYLDTLYAQAVLNCSKTWLEKTMIAWQMWGSTQWNRKCQDFQGSVRLALDVGSTYIEIYQEDLLIPELATVAEEVNRELKSQVRQYGRPRMTLKALPPRPGAPPGKKSPSTKPGHP